MSRVDTTEDWILEDLAAITGKDIKELRRNKSKTKSTPVNRHKYFRRPGKRHNNDFCFSCHEGGTLLCCDGCTKSFHLLCLDPPMEDEDIPEGEWLCKTCKLGSNSSDCSISLKFTRNRKRSIEHDDSEETKEAKLVRCIWSQLVRKAIESDPKEYENPLDCRTIPYIFPGDSKSTKKNQIKPKHPHSTQCYICGKGVSKQSMINCDYCERSFHLDCTDPPLTVPPKYFWMCQFHIEPCLEKIYFQEEEIPSLSQRIALWNMCREPLDHEAVKLEFLRNTVTEKCNLVQLPTYPIEIPDAVYNHYNNRPDMIPSLKEALRLVGYNQSVEYLHTVPKIFKSNHPEKITSKEEQDLWLATVLGFQKEVILKLNTETTPDLFKLKKEKLIERLEESKVEIIEKERNEEEEIKTDGCESSHSSTSEINKKIKIKKPHDEITRIIEAAVSELPEADECLNIMNYLDEDFINLLAFQRLCQLTNQNRIYDKIIESKNLYVRRYLDDANRTKNLTNAELENFIGSELENTLKEEETCIKHKERTVGAETVTICCGENFNKIPTEELKSMIENEKSENNKTEFGEGHAMLAIAKENVKEHMDFDEEENVTFNANKDLTDDKLSKSVSRSDNVTMRDADHDSNKTDFNKDVKNLIIQDDIKERDVSEKYSTTLSAVEEDSEIITITDDENIDKKIEVVTSSKEDEVTAKDYNKKLKIDDSQIFELKEDIEMKLEDKIDTGDILDKKSVVIKCKDEISNEDIIKVPIDLSESACLTANILGVLTSVDKKSELFPIYKSGFIIGKGSRVNLDLNKIQHCNFTSNHHAVIYFDSRTHLWEIINYSRFGCRVNNVLLSFDIPKKSLQNILDDDSDEELCTFHEKIKDISKKELEKFDNALIKKERAEMVKGFFENPCDCDPSQMHSNMASTGWNNSVPFGHGSLLQFGCIRIVFGDTSYVTT